jgi:hypothetical protein
MEKKTLQHDLTVQVRLKAEFKNIKEEALADNTLLKHISKEDSKSDLLKNIAQFSNDPELIDRVENLIIEWSVQELNTGIPSKSSEDLDEYFA